ncbi:MAG: hypothetical protein QOH61_2385 [Chloroflexota bacterium]|nr:hypothetical protein [Chloroflexota bacterium]
MRRIARVHRRTAGLALVACLAVIGVTVQPIFGADSAAPDSTQRIRNELVALRSTVGDAFSYAFFDTGSGQLEIQTDAPAAAFESVASRYRGRIEIKQATIGLTSGRLADTSPFYGGASLNDGTSLCTSAYVAKTATTRYLVTGGHCFPLNAQIRANRFAGQGQIVGTVTKRDYPAYESELISGGSYLARIYNGANGDDTTNVPIVGQKIDVNGTSGYCRTGQSSGNSCNWTLVNTNATFCAHGNCTDFVNAFNGGVQPVGGDSGGPIYYPHNGGALMAGTIIGYSCILILCSYYGEKVGSILGKWNLTLVCNAACLLL